MADAMEAAKKALAEDRKVREKSAAEFAERMKGKPTPTQQELDLAKLGATFTEHEADGSNLDTTASLPDEKKLLEQSRREYEERMAAGPPVPSQAELDKAAQGEVVETRHMEAAPAARPQTYQTRQMRPAPAAPAAPAAEPKSE